MPWPLLPEPEDGETTEQTETAGIRPFVRDEGGTRSLYFSLDALQSRMDSRQPWQLEVDYTRTMMGFLLFRPDAVDIGMVGLGGGSLAKFCYRELPACRFEVAEINPHVIALRRDFGLPDDDARLSVLECDGVDFVAARAGRFDALLIDGFDLDGQPPQLCSQQFYDDCHAALAPGGLLAVNLHHDHPDYPLHLARLQRSFSGNAVPILAPEKSNAIVFASTGAAISPRRLSVPAARAGLSPSARLQLKSEFARVLWSMQDLSADD